MLLWGVVFCEGLLCSSYNPDLPTTNAFKFLAKPSRFKMRFERDPTYCPTSSITKLWPACL